jgi:soluble lytic murein transglycosylase
MPTLPRVDTSQSVFANVPLAGQNIQVSPENFGGQVAQAVGGLGQAGERAGGDVLQAGLLQKGVQDETSANNAYNSFANDVRTTTTSLYQQDGKAAVDAVPAANQAIEDARQKYRSSLSDPQAQRLFDQVSTRHVQSTLDANARFGSVQQKTYEDQTSDGMVNNFQQGAAQVWNDPAAFNSQLANIVTERVTHGQMRGQPQEFIDAKVQSDMSASWIDRLRGIAAAGDAQTALTLLNNGEDWTDSAGQKRHTDVRAQILPAQLASIQSQLSSHAADQIGVQYGNSATSPAPGGASLGVRNNNPGNLRNPQTGQFQQYATFQQGQQAADANLSAYGSQHGINTIQGVINRWAPKGDGNNDPQAYAATVAKAVGIAPDDKVDLSDPAQRKKILNAMFDVESPGWRAAQNQPAPPGGAAGAVSGTLPVGNAAGVPNAAQIAPPPTGLAQDPATMKANQDASAESARQQAESHVLALTGDSIAAKRAGQTAASTVVSNTNAAIEAQRSRQTAAAGQLNKMIAGDPSTNTAPISSFAQLIANPVAYANYSQLSPAGQAAVTERLTNPSSVHMTQDSLDSYYKMKGEAINDPESFMKEDLSAQFGKIPEAQLMQLINQQSAISKKDVAGQARALNWGRTKGEVSDIVNSAIPKDDPNKADRTTQFYGKLQEALDQYHDQNQKYPDAQTTRKIAGGLMAQGTQGSPSLLPSWLGGNAPIRAFESPDINKFQVPVPPDRKPALAASFQKVTGRAPTDDELSQAYTAFTLNQTKKTSPVSSSPTQSVPAQKKNDVDELDYSNKFNTQLSSSDETKFDSWAAALSKKEGRDVTKDMYDYDLKGAWKQGADQAANGHFPDTFKKPNHPTFSDQSKYSVAGGDSGGVWSKQGDKDVYTPTAAHIKTYGVENLKKYFAREEPDSVLDLSKAK